MLIIAKRNIQPNVEIEAEKEAEIEAEMEAEMEAGVAWTKYKMSMAILKNTGHAG